MLASAAASVQIAGRHPGLPAARGAAQPTLPRSTSPTERRVRLASPSQYGKDWKPSVSSIARSRLRTRRSARGTSRRATRLVVSMDRQPARRICVHIRAELEEWRDRWRRLRRSWRSTGEPAARAALLRTHPLVFGASVTCLGRDARSGTSVRGGTRGGISPRRTRSFRLGLGHFVRSDSTPPSSSHGALRASAWGCDSLGSLLHLPSRVRAARRPVKTATHRATLSSPVSEMLSTCRRAANEASRCSGSRAETSRMRTRRSNSGYELERVPSGTAAWPAIAACNAVSSTRREAARMLLEPHPQPAGRPKACSAA